MEVCERGRQGHKSLGEYVNDPLQKGSSGETGRQADESGLFSFIVQMYCLYGWGNLQ